jgi:hypothetical protein
MPSAQNPNSTCDVKSVPMPEPSTTLTSDTTAPADRSNPPVSTTTVCPMAASARAAPPADMKLNSK